MSDLLGHAMRGATHTPPAAAAARPRLLVLGGGGALGSAVLEHALPAGRFGAVAALVDAPLASGLSGFDPLPADALRTGRPLQADVAVLVFERERHANGRDAVFVQPKPDELLPWAQALQQGGVRALLVVVPHAPALLPAALAGGFASLDEQAVAALGFERVLFLRAARVLRGDAAGGWLPRLAAWWLGQLHWMVPQRQQPLRAAQLGRCVALLARLLPAAPPGTRVLPTEPLWLAVQPGVDTEAALQAWLHGQPLPEPPAAGRRG